MKQKPRDFGISGYVTDENGYGVFGLTVLAYDKDLIFHDRLGRAYTDQDGSFRLRFVSDAFADLFEARPDLFIEVRDILGTRVFSSKHAIKWPAGKEVQIDATVRRDKLSAHAAACTPLIRKTGGLVANADLDTIEEALGLVQSRIDRGLVPPLGKVSGVSGSGNLYPLSAAYCPAPDILGFGNILDDAWGTIVDDPRAVRAFQDILDTIFHRVKVRAPQNAAAALRDWAEDRSMDYGKVSDLIELRLENAVPAAEYTLIEKDRVLPVMLAAVLAARSDRIIENRNMGVVLGQLRGLVQFDRVFRAARGALASNPGGVPGLADMLSHVGGTCGPDCGPAPFPPRPDDVFDLPDYVHLEMLQCAREMGQAIRSGALSGGTYHIATADFGDGCPGATVILTGADFEGFLPDRNRVVFTHQDGIGRVDVAPAAPTDWTDTRIEVTLPANAGPGPVHLSLVGNFTTACGRAITPPRHGNSVQFNGGSAYIRRFTANHLHGDSTVAAGATVRLRWTVVPSSSTVHLRIVQDGAVIADGTEAAESFRDIMIPAGIVTETVCTLQADNACPGSATETITLTGCEIADLSVHGMEVSQAVQYYRSSEHLTDPADRGANNSAALVCDKPAWVRVYLRSGLPASFNSGQLPDVDGTLRIERRVSGVWTTIANLNPVNAPLTVEESFANHDVERSDIDASLNFIVPANVMTGLLRFTVTASSTARCAGSAATESILLDVNLEQDLQVATLRIGYDGPNLAGTATETHPAPQLFAGANSVAAACDFALSIFPVSSNLILRDLGTDDATAPLNSAGFAAGSCDPNWSPIITLVADARTADGNQAGWIYYGFVTENIPRTHDNTGCAIGTNAAGLVDGAATFAHEAGHQMGMAHSPCGNVGTPNPSFPLYEPYDTGATVTNAAGDTIYSDASTGEYGIDVNGGRVLPPNTTSDFMSYCGPRWVSLYSHEFMANNTMLNPSTVSTGYRAGAGGDGRSRQGNDVLGSEPRKLITMIGRVSEDGQVSVTSVSRLRVHPPLINGLRTDYQAQLIGDSGQVIDTAPAFTLPHRVHTGTPGHEKTLSTYQRGQSFAFIAVLNDLAEGVALQLVKDGEVAWRKNRPEAKPVIDKAEAVLEKDGRLRVNWSVDAPHGEDLTTWLRWSRDNGTNWNALAVNQQAKSGLFSTDTLPPCPIIVQVVVNDGFQTVTRVTGPVSIPQRPPLVGIVHPLADRPVSRELPVRLLATFQSRSETVLGDDDFVWEIDGQIVGRGRDIWVSNPGSGSHQIKVTITDEVGEASAESTFQCE